jgi:hypothetical protein
MPPINTINKKSAGWKVMQQSLRRRPLEPVQQQQEPLSQPEERKRARSPVSASASASSSTTHFEQHAENSVGVVNGSYRPVLAARDRAEQLRQVDAERQRALHQLEIETQARQRETELRMKAQAGECSLICGVMARRTCATTAAACR